MVLRRARSMGAAWVRNRAWAVGGSSCHGAWHEQADRDGERRGEGARRPSPPSRRKQVGGYGDSVHSGARPAGDRPSPIRSTVSPARLMWEHRGGRVWDPLSSWGLPHVQRHRQRSRDQPEHLSISHLHRRPVGAGFTSAAPGGTEDLTPQIVPSGAGVQTVFFSFAIGFALLQPYLVGVSRYDAPAPGERLCVMAACRLVRHVLCGELDALRACYVVG